MFRRTSTLGSAVLLTLVSREAGAQDASPFLTGATALQANILAWLTPVAIILIMVLGGMAMANRLAQVSGTYGASEAQTIIENCSNTLILRCAASEHGGTSHFASRLIGQREVIRTTVSRSRRPLQWLASTTRAEHSSIEPAVLDSEIEQLPDLSGYLKFASVPDWYRVRLTPEASTALKHGREASDDAGSAVARMRAEERQPQGHARGHVSGGGNVLD